MAQCPLAGEFCHFLDHINSTASGKPGFSRLSAVLSFYTEEKPCKNLIVVTCGAYLI